MTMKRLGKMVLLLLLCTAQPAFAENYLDWDIRGQWDCVIVVSQDGKVIGDGAGQMLVEGGATAIDTDDDTYQILSKIFVTGTTENAETNLIDEIEWETAENFDWYYVLPSDNKNSSSGTFPMFTIEQSDPNHFVMIAYPGDGTEYTFTCTKRNFGGSSSGCNAMPFVLLTPLLLAPLTVCTNRKRV